MSINHATSKKEKEQRHLPENKKSGLQVFTVRKGTYLQIGSMPGPASTVEERTLRKFCQEETAVRSPPRTFLFSCEFIRKKD